MRVHRFEDARAFADRVTPFLERAEAENNLVLGIAAALVRGAAPYPRATKGTPLLAVVEDESGALVTVAVRTPPEKLVLTRAPAAAIEALAADLLVADPEIEGILGPVEEAAHFASLWSRATGAQARIGIPQRVYQLDRVIEPARVPGALRPARLAEVPLLGSWAAGFSRDADAPTADPEGIVRRKIEAGALWVWDDGGPASMTSVAGPTRHGIRIGLVYTPDERRGRGYASACVAAVSGAQLAAGRRFCFLYTDLRNPTSNKIYQAIGYRPVADFVDWWIE